MQSALLKGIDALFITNPTNIRYLTGFVGVDPSERDAYVLLTVDEIYLFTSSLYLEQAKSLTNFQSNKVTTLTIIEVSRDNPISKALLSVFSSVIPAPEQGSIQNTRWIPDQARNDKTIRVEFEETDLTVAELRKLKETLTDVEFVPTQNRIETMRMIKRKDEIENIRLAASITDQCFTYITKRIRLGITEARLAWEIESFLKMKAGDIAFSPVVAFNEHSSEPHYMKRSNNPLRKNSLILLDFGARVNGYCADMTRVVFLGTPKKEWITAYNTVLSANTKTIELLKRGERDGGKLDSECNIPPYPHTLGHAVGLDIHEAPRLTHKKPELLKSNMVVTIEPGMYLEGQYGIRIEDLVLLKDNGIEILSKSSKKMTII